jgi:hypothetical protein
LTLRQFYLLLAEHYSQQKSEDQRWYRLICCWTKDTPPFEQVFPLWGEGVAAVSEVDGDEFEDERMFRNVTAALTPYRN